MTGKKLIVGACLAVVLAASGCSRQQSDWQKTRETNTADAYEQYLKKYPTGEFSAQAQARVKELYEEREWQKARDADTPEAYQAFLKQYPEGKWTEEARIRVENFSLAQAPSGTAAQPPAAEGGSSIANAPPGAEAAAGASASAPPPSQSEAPPTPKHAAAHSAAAAPSAASPAEAGSFGVQLGAFKSGPHAAHERWAHLQKEYPALLGGLKSKVVPKKTLGGNLYRLQATGLTEKHARSICDGLKAKAQACVVVPPLRG